MMPVREREILEPAVLPTGATNKWGYSIDFNEKGVSGPRRTRYRRLARPALIRGSEPSGSLPGSPERVQKQKAVGRSPRVPERLNDDWA